MKKYRSFKAFYPYYLSEHADPTCRRLHYVGSVLVLCVLAFALMQQAWIWLLALPVLGYGFAWVGHFFFEKNKPATFSYPLYSLAADWVMLKDALLSQLGFKTPLDVFKNPPSTTDKNPNTL